MAGKGDKPRPVDMDKAVIYCEHNRFNDKCEKCKCSCKCVKLQINGVVICDDCGKEYTDWTLLKDNFVRQEL